MKKIFLFLYTLLVFSGVYAQENKVKVEPVNGDKISLFSLKEVRLLDSDFKHIMDLNHAYMLSLEPDRLLSWFRREAGLTPKAQPYPFWESEYMNGHGPLPGHIMGFYLSGISMMYDSTGDISWRSYLFASKLEVMDICYLLFAVELFSRMCWMEISRLLILLLRLLMTNAGNLCMS